MTVSGISFKIEVDTKQVATALKSVSSAAKQTTGDFQEVAQASPFSKMASSVKSFASKVSQLAVAGLAVKAVGAAFSYLKDNVNEALSASDSLDKFQQTMQFAGIDKKAIGEAGAAVKKYADDTVYDLSTVANTTAQLASNGIKDYTGLTQAAGNLNAVAGGNADTFKSVAMMLTQTAGAGKLTTENWNQLADAIPGASGPLQDALKKAGAYTGNFRDAMADGQITADEFNSALMNLGMSDVAKEAAISTSTFEGAFGSLEATVVNGLQSMIDGIGKGNLVGLINGFTGAVEKGFNLVSTAIQTLMPYVSRFFSDMGGKFTEFQPVIEQFGTVFSNVFSAIVDVAMPLFETVVNGIMTYIDILVQYWTGIFNGDNSVFNSFTRIFVAIKTVAVPILQDAISFIQDIISQLTAFWDENGQQIIAAVQTVFSMVASIIEFVMPAVQLIIESVWRNIKGVIQGALDVILGLVKIFAAVFTGDWSGLWEGIKQLFSGAMNFLWNLWSLIGMGKILGGIKSFVSVGFASIKGFCTNVVNAFKGVWTTTSSIWNGIKSVISGAINGAKSIVSSVVNSVKSTVSSVWNGIKSTTSSVWNGIKSAMTSPITAAKNTIAGIINRVKSLFNFKLKFPSVSIPHIPLPHFSISGSFNPLKGQLPKIGIDWYQTGGIFTGASVIGVGENGDEAVVPLSNKSRMAPFAKAVSDMMKDEYSGGGVGGLSSGVLQPVKLTYIAQLDKKVLFKDNVDYMIEVTQQAQRSRARIQGKRTF